MIWYSISYPEGSPFVLGAGERADLTERVDGLLLTVDTSGQEGLLLEGQEVPEHRGMRRTCQSIYRHGYKNFWYLSKALHIDNMYVYVRIKNDWVL